MTTPIPVSAFPRLLVATEFPPNSAGGGGAIIRQMLKDWPVEKLGWWSCRPDNDQHFGQRVAAHAVATIPLKLYPNRRFRQLKRGLLAQLWVPWAKRHFRRTVSHFCPDVIWAIPHGWSIPPLAGVLLRADLAFHLSVHDYPDLSGAMDRTEVRRLRELAEQVDRLYSRATTRDTVCRAMADDFKIRTGCDGDIGRAGLDQEDLDYLSRAPEPPRSSIRIAYAGTIIAEQTFGIFARALAAIRNRLAKPLELDFFGDHFYRERPWFDGQWMHERGNLPAAKLSQALKDYDWGFAPMELTDENPRYNRFSLPTKLVSYLAAGLPVIALGHAESTVVKMASQYEIGLCSTSADAENLETQLLAALSEPEPKPRYRPEIQRCALAEFDARRIRAVLYENLRKCAATAKAGKRN